MAKPAVVIRPTWRPPCSKASGIIVLFGDAVQHRSQHDGQPRALRLLAARALALVPAHAVDDAVAHEERERPGRQPDGHAARAMGGVHRPFDQVEGHRADEHAAAQGHDQSQHMAVDGHYQGEGSPDHQGPRAHRTPAEGLSHGRTVRPSHPAGGHPGGVTSAGAGRGSVTPSA
jgi:hypothetical protein